MKKLYWLALVFIFNFTLVWSSEETYRLEKLIEIIKNENLHFHIHELEQELSEQDFKITRSLTNPEIEWSNGQGTVFNAPDQNSLWSLKVEFDIPNPVYHYYRVRSAKKSISLKKIHSEIKNRSLIKELKYHFFRYQFQKVKESFLLEKKDVLTEISRLMKARADIGEAREIDYLRSSVELQKNDTALFKIKKRLAYEKDKINELLNYSLPADFMILEDFNFNPLGGVEDTAEEILLKGPLMESKREEAEQQKWNWKATQFSLLETFTFFTEKEQEVDADIWRIGIGLAVPIFKTVSQSRKKAKLELKIAQKKMELRRIQLLAAYKRIISEIRILEKEIETFQGSILKEGLENLELSKKLFLAGEIPLIVFLDTQNSFFELKIRYYNALTEWKTAKADLEEIMGVEL